MMNPAGAPARSPIPAFGSREHLRWLREHDDRHRGRSCPVCLREIEALAERLAEAERLLRALVELHDLGELRPDHAASCKSRRHNEARAYLAAAAGEGGGLLSCGTCIAGYPPHAECLEHGA